MYGYGYDHKILTNPSEGATAAYVSVAAGDVFRYSPNKPCMVLRWGFIATTTVNDATNALKLSCDFRPTAGSDTGRLKGNTFSVAAAAGFNASGTPAIFIDYGGTGTTLGKGGGKMTLTASTTQVVAGSGIWHTVQSQAPTGSTVVGGVITALGGLYPAPDTSFVPPGGMIEQFMVYPGQEVLIASNATAPGAGAGIFFMEVLEFPFVGDFNNHPQSVSGIPASIAPNPSNALKNMTRVNT